MQNLHVSNGIAVETAVRLLCKLPIFSQLSAELIGTLAAKCRIKYADEGEILIDESWPVSPGLFVLTAGEVRVERRSGRERVVIATRSKGDSLGELSLLDGLPPSATVVAATDVEAVILPREEFIACLERSKSLSREIIKVLAMRLREATEEKVAVQTKDVRSRLAAELLQLASRQSPGNLKPVIRLEMSQAELGGKFGVSRESINKALKSLQQGNPPPMVAYGVNRGAYRLNLDSMEKAARG